MKILKNDTTLLCPHCGGDVGINFYDKNSEIYKQISEEIDATGGVRLICFNCGEYFFVENE